jgi:hypothetical protein
VAFSAAGRPVPAAVALGVSAWIKLPGVLAAPALVMGFREPRQRFIFGAVAALTGVLTYVPTLLADPGILYVRVFSYPGQIIQTTAGIRVWGLQNFLDVVRALPDSWQPVVGSAVIWFFQHNRLAVFVPLIAFAWMRRGEQSARGLGWTLAGCYSMVYAFSNNWSFQYFAWSIPFWFLAGRLYLAGATLLAGGYIYALYALDCGNPFLLGTWDFIGHPYWPISLQFLRDAAVLFFLTASLVFLVRAARAELQRKTSAT